MAASILDYALSTSSHRVNANREIFTSQHSSTSWRRKSQSEQPASQPTSRKKKVRTVLVMENYDEGEEKTLHHFRTAIRWGLDCLGYMKIGLSLKELMITITIRSVFYVLTLYEKQKSFYVRGYHTRLKHQQRHIKFCLKSRYMLAYL